MSYLRPPTELNFFESIFRAQTLLNLVYLFLSFPLGIFYFVLLVTGISLGFGLLITVFGIFILVGVLALVYVLAIFERNLLSTFLGFHLGPLPQPERGTGFMSHTRALLLNPFTWKGMLFLFLKFPLGIFSFSISISLIAASIGLIATPILFHFHWFEMGIPGFWMIDTIGETLLMAAVGIPLLLVSLYLLNLLAWGIGYIGKALLEQSPGYLANRRH